MKLVRKVFYGGWGPPRAVIEEVERDEVEQQARENMAVRNNPMTPNWRDDPTYNLARPGARRRRS